MTAQGLLLDTHALVWLVQGSPRLGRKAKRRLQSAPGLYISAITPWEVGMLVAKSRLVLREDPEAWLSAVLSVGGLHLLPLDPSIAIQASRLPGDLHGDPADRLIAATARHHGLTLVTADQALLRYGEQGHIGVLPAEL